MVIVKYRKFESKFELGPCIIFSYRIRIVHELVKVVWELYVAYSCAVFNIIIF